VAQFIQTGANREGIVEVPLDRLVFQKPGASFLSSSILSICFCESRREPEYSTLKETAAPPDEK